MNGNADANTIGERIALAQAIAGEEEPRLTSNTASEDPDLVRDHWRWYLKALDSALDYALGMSAEDWDEYRRVTGGEE